MTRLDETQRDAALAHLDGWRADGDAIVCTYRFKSFGDAIEFVNRVADIAEERDHHPDIDIRFREVSLRLTTHSQGGVTERDVAVAEAVERIPR